VGGRAGAETALGLLREELAVALHLMGCPSPAHLGRSHVTVERRA
jgi:isopentenyl diphosphate isomerase/L-lactate dehydrogenase-like FMN-dependent dehydrogenase